ncbi:NAD(P)H-dependent oxidoreductase subunit E [Petrotoga sp. 9PWA.NaAc.5.4]|uniref:NADH-quinone oxidoreductase subunit NuoE family protein n=1 Tax=Petrotoga sp. 9PWA.NaAc.5.4 TaxID=1434328 RepID=UPI000CB8D1DC|nr:NAD(P)H-dependent oxidoreductase subunit E [Petrotoga sp. 9PWA.NaAc.5.4]PNR96724.1 NADH dehydrogenase [Petrotoga sp. 9PWA.NaAc.5.4]
MEKYYEKELLEELHDVQETYGFISEEDILRISKKRNIPKAHLYGVISFYSMFHLEPTGKYIIRICDSVSCRLNNSVELLKTLKEYLNVEENQTTKDKKFTLEVVECLGHCDEGPVMMVNDTYYTHLTTNKVIKILDSLE